MFDILAERFSNPSYPGCLTLTALIEFHDPDHPIYRAAMEHQKNTADDLAELLDADVTAEQRGQIGRQLLQLVDTAMLAALYNTSARPAAEARDTAEAIINHQTN